MNTDKKRLDSMTITLGDKSVVRQLNEKEKLTLEWELKHYGTSGALNAMRRRLRPQFEESLNTKIKFWDIKLELNYEKL